MMNPHLITVYLECNYPTFVANTTQSLVCEYLILAQSISHIRFGVRVQMENEISDPKLTSTGSIDGVDKFRNI
jgi:hypothetical protein